ncbi:sensor histidine kinase [Algibacter pectinivorans]|uniref:histidine kinase n=1 Tax=Algibacter pectinivorans TaxID=870482 RepID=A0A1I1PVD3_9FLAO|nr:PAS domain-containing sensor histidine kinase [Algibacter pectinivorans]SFD13622.1 PAS domain S-box-containing protein [Algibacter pectinivorans]
MNYLKKELYNLVKSDDTVFEFIQSNSLDGMWYWDLENPENEWMNKRFWETLGYNPENMPHKASAWHNIINQNDLELATANFKKHLSNPKHPYDQVVRYTHKNGRTIWIRCKGFAIRNNKGEPIRMLGSHIEVTNLKEQELFLHRCNQEAHIGYWELDVSNKTVSWSETTKNIHEVDGDYQPSLETGINFYKKGYSRKRITELVLNALEKGEGFTEELQIVTKLNHTKWVKVIGIPEKNNNSFKRVYGTIQDIDLLKTNQIKLKQSEQAFRGSFENAAIGMAILDVNGKWLKVNQTLCNILGYTAIELHELTFQDITHPDDLDLDLHLLKQIIAGKRDHYKMDKRYFHKNGHIVYIHLAVSVVRDTNNDVLHFVSQIVDITLIKEQEMRLEKIISITKEQNERLKNFAHIVSHNLRSHSGGMAALLGILKSEQPELFNNEMVQLLETSSQNLEDTIADLSEIVQINMLSKETLTNIPIKPIIDQQIESILPLAEINKVKIKNNIPEDLEVVGIKAYLDSIVLNFITNAIKYRSKDRDSYLNIDYKKNSTYTSIEFTDNGLGINLDLHKKKLFGMYKTFHRNEDSKGIGLFITKNQVEALGGKIEVESTENIGTTFKVNFRNEKN